MISHVRYELTSLPACLPACLPPSLPPCLPPSLTAGNLSGPQRSHLETISCVIAPLSVCGRSKPELCTCSGMQDGGWLCAPLPKFSWVLVEEFSDTSTSVSSVASRCVVRKRAIPRACQSPVTSSRKATTLVMARRVSLSLSLSLSRSRSRSRSRAPSPCLPHLSLSLSLSETRDGETHRAVVNVRAQVLPPGMGSQSILSAPAACARSSLLPSLLWSCDSKRLKGVLPVLGFLGSCLNSRHAFAGIR